MKEWGDDYLPINADGKGNQLKKKKKKVNGDGVNGGCGLREVEER